MLENLTYATFSECVGTSFALQADIDPPIVLELTEANRLPNPKNAGNRQVRTEPFSLLFKGPTTPYIPQQTYTLDHEMLGQLSIFFVPVSQDEAGLYYEAVFT